jgi:pre-mRNA-processing factor 17
VHEAWKNGGDLIGERKIPKSVTRAMKRKRKGKGTLGEFDEEEEEEEEEAPLGEGELAPVDVDGEPIIAQKREKADKVQKEYLGPWAGWEDEYIGVVGPTAEQWEEQAEDGGAPLTKKQRKQVVLDEGKREIGFGEEKSIFHGSFSRFLAISHLETRRLIRMKL